MDCVIAIPTYFAGRMLTNCIDSIMVNVKSPKVLVYKNQDGWLKAANHLMEVTSHDIILLNDDTIVTTDIVSEMQEVAYSDDQIGIVGGKSLSPDGEYVINYGIYVGTDGNTAHKHFGQHRSKIVLVENQQAVEGSCMYLKREMLDQIGYFDEGYGLGYREEVDLAFRAREAGWKVVSAPKAEYIHLTSQTNSPLGITNDTMDYFLSKWGTKLKLGKV